MMLMDRLGLITPAHENAGLEFTPMGLPERSFEVETARQMGCVILHGSDARWLPASSEHIAIHPESGNLTVWLDQLVETGEERPADDDLAPTTSTYATIRIDHLAYRGIFRREARALGRLRHHYSLAESIRLGDRVALGDPDGSIYKSHKITVVG